MEFAEIVSFHGHSCPGLAIGYRMSMAAMQTLELVRSADEEVFAIVENDACGVDALQCLTGCSFGKGNLLFRDHGKHVYTLYSRAKEQAVRVSFNWQVIPAAVREDRKVFADYLLHADAEQILSIKMVPYEDIRPARIRASADCAHCGESVMETRLSEVAGKLLCIPCAEQARR